MTDAHISRNQSELEESSSPARSLPTAGKKDCEQGVIGLGSKLGVKTLFKTMARDIYSHKPSHGKSKQVPNCIRRDRKPLCCHVKYLLAHAVILDRLHTETR